MNALFQKRDRHVFVFPQCQTLLNNNKCVRCGSFKGSSLLDNRDYAGSFTWILITNTNSHVTQYIVNISLYTQFTKWMQVKETAAEFRRLQKGAERNANRSRVCTDKITSRNQLQGRSCCCGVQASRELRLREDVDQGPMFRQLEKHGAHTIKGLNSWKIGYQK